MNTSTQPRVIKGRLRYAVMGRLLRVLGRHAGPLVRRAGRATELPAVPDLVRLLESWGTVGMSTPDSSYAELLAGFPELTKVQVSDQLIAGPERQVAARLYRLPGVQVREALVWVHGGAFVMGDLDMPESHWVGLMLAASGIPVIALDYVKALHGKRYCALNQDVLTGWRWALGEFQRQGIAVGQVHFGGASAGANLVACVSKWLRDAQETLPASLLLIYPLLHGVLPEISALLLDRVRTNPGAVCFEPEWIESLGLHYVGHPAVEQDPYAYGANGNVRGLPTTLVVNCTYDTLRVSGEAFVQQLWDSGGEVRLHEEPEAVHGALNAPGRPEASRMLALMAEWIRGGYRAVPGTLDRAGE